MEGQRYFSRDVQVNGIFLRLRMMIFWHSYYGHKFTSVIEKNNIFGIQFHPEKSQKFGIEILKNFINL